MGQLGRLIFLLCFVLVTLFYARYEYNKNVNLFEDKVEDLILKNVPKFTFKIFPSLDELKTEEILSNNKVKINLFHFWGTWCAPCIPEIPEFLEFAKKLEARPVAFYLVAVNDEVEKVRVFLKKYPVLPSNVTILFDEKGESMREFGTVKVPETYMFNTEGKIINKYIGPQNWNNEYYLNYVIRFLP